MAEQLTREQKQLIVLAQSLRGGVVTRRTTERKTGYEIRPLLRLILPPPEGKWSVGRASSAFAVLLREDIPIRKTYSQETEITALLKLIEGLEELSPTSHGLEVVRKYNGILKQPRTHEEVVAAIDMLDSVTDWGHTMPELDERLSITPRSEEIP
jgi:hypothetical protein